MVWNRIARHCRRYLWALAILPMGALAQSAYPGDRAVAIEVPYAPGGTLDLVARLVGKQLTSTMGGNFIVENRPGASGTIAMSYVARAKPDGHTLYLYDVTSTVVSELVPDLNFDPIKSFAHTVLIAQTPSIVVVNSKVPAHNLQELIAYAKANPGRVHYGSGGVGSGPHLSGELFRQITETDVVHVPYRGSGPAMQDLLSGQIEMLITAAPTFAPYLNEGRLRALAVTQLERSPAFPDVPSLTEAGLPGLEISNWYELAAPAGTPKAVIDTIAEGVNRALKEPDLLKGLAAAGLQPLGGTSEQARQFIGKEAKRWQTLVRAGGTQAKN